jgi:hypothetical protein
MSKATNVIPFPGQRVASGPDEIKKLGVELMAAVDADLRRKSSSAKDTRSKRKGGRSRSKACCSAKIVKLRPVRSLYELYPLPFFDAENHNTWAVRPSGDYGADCETGKKFAIKFLATCDGTNGWRALLQFIVGDMIRAGPTKGSRGRPSIDGVTVGFLSIIGDFVATGLLLLPSLKPPPGAA